MNQLLTALQTALANVTANPQAASILAKMLHQNSTATGVDIDKRTMTVAWEQANPTEATVLLSEPPDPKTGLVWRIVQ